MIRRSIFSGSNTARLRRVASRNYGSSSVTNSIAGTASPKFKSLSADKFDNQSTLKDVSDGQGNLDLHDGAAEEEFLSEDEEMLKEDAAWDAQFDSPSNGLPLSPFMDPEYAAAKNKYRIAKARPSDFPTPFQIKLARNPYAKMLDTPVRQCQVTKTTLPNFFLQAFGTMSHPETHEPWQVPVGLSPNKGVLKFKEAQLEKKLKGAIGLAGQVPTTEDRGGGTLLKTSRDGAASDSTAGEESRISTATTPEISSKLHGEGVRIGATNYTLARQDLLRHFNEPASSYKQGWKMLSSTRLSRGTAARKIASSTKWRGDMDTFLLELMRRRAKEQIWQLANTNRGYVAASQDWADATKPSRQAGAILWLGPYSPIGDTVGDGHGEQVVIPEFATLDRGQEEHKIQISVHNLRRLLGPEHFAELRAEFSLFRNEIVNLKDRSRTAEVRMRLWKLEGFVATWGAQLPYKSVAELPGLLPDDMDDFDMKTMTLKPALRRRVT